MTPHQEHILQAPARGDDDHACTCGHWHCYTKRTDFAKDMFSKHREKVAA